MLLHNLKKLIFLKYYYYYYYYCQKNKMHPSPHSRLCDLINFIHDIENNKIKNVNNESNNSKILKLLLLTAIQIQDHEALQQRKINVLQTALVKQSTRHQIKIDKLQSEINLQKRLNDHLINKLTQQQIRIDELCCEINNLKNNENNKCLPLSTRCFTQAEICGIKDEQCCVCMDKPKNHAFTGCGHMCVCGDCVDRCFNKCPLCRTEGSYMRIIY